MKNTKRKNLPSRASLVRQLDAEFSRQIQKRDNLAYSSRCPFCGREPIECAFHFVRKSRSTRLRWDVRNVVGSCFKCNFAMEHAEGPFWAWYFRKYGLDATEKLQAESHIPAPWNRSTLSTMLIWLKSGSGLGSISDPLPAPISPREPGEGETT